jgi:hypothetical protein
MDEEIRTHLDAWRFERIFRREKEHSMILAAGKWGIRRAALDVSKSGQEVMETRAMSYDKVVP